MTKRASLPEITMIAAMDRNRVIGVDNDLPWRLPADLARFKRLSLNKPIIMGRKTHDSIGRPLPNRLNIVMTRSRQYEAPGCLIARNIDEAIELAGDADEIIIGGGGYIYKLFLSRATRLELTYVDVELNGDSYFPEFDESEWEEAGRHHHPADEKHAYDFTFVTWRRPELA